MTEDFCAYKIYNCKNIDVPKCKFDYKHASFIESNHQAFNYIAKSLYPSIEDADLIAPIFEPDVYIHIDVSVATVYERCLKNVYIESPFMIYKLLGSESYLGQNIQANNPISIVHLRKLDKLYHEFYKNKQNVYYLDGNTNDVHRLAELALQVATLEFSPKCLDNTKK